MKNEKVVVTGLGSVNGLALNVEDFWARLCRNESAIRAWQDGQAKGIPIPFAAPVDWQAFMTEFGHHEILKTNMERRSAFGSVAACQAIEDAGLSDTHKRENLTNLNQLGVITGSGVPQREERDELSAYSRNGYDWNHWWSSRDMHDRNNGTSVSNDHLATHLARYFHAHGPVMNVSSACAGAAQAIGMAFHMIRRGETPIMLAGGSDSVLNTMTIVGLNLLGAPSTKETLGDTVCRPFDIERSGLVAGEGGAMVVLESESHARARGAKIYAEIVGYGSSLDAYKITAPHPEGLGQAQAMYKSLHDAKVPAEHIDYINAHGTSTPLNDVAETMAIKTVFAKDTHYKTLAVSSIKAHIGHLIAAAGAGEFVATVLATQQQYIPATLNLENPDPQCDLDYVPKQSRAHNIQYAMSNSFGFGGLNASLVVANYVR